MAIWVGGWVGFKVGSRNDPCPLRFTGRIKQMPWPTETIGARKCVHPEISPGGDKTTTNAPMTRGVPRCGKSIDIMRDAMPNLSVGHQMATCDERNRPAENPNLQRRRGLARGEAPKPKRRHGPLHEVRI